MISIERIRELAAKPLLQHGYIPRVEELNVAELDHQTLTNALNLGRAFCDTGYHMVAYTQFNPEVLRQAGIREDQARLIYVSSKATYSYLPDMLLINPVLIQTNGCKLLLSTEGCGSLRQGKLSYWIYRPNQAHLDCHIYFEGAATPQPFERDVTSTDCFMLAHERDHLDGLTAADLTMYLLDFRNFDSARWNYVGYNWGNYDPTEELASISPQWLIFDKQNQRLQVVDPNGQFIEWLD